MIKFLDLKAQYIKIKDEIDNAIASVINDSAFIGGKYVKDFEESFAEYIGVNHCVTVGNGTDALEIAIESLNLPPRSEIIVPGNTFIASSEAITRSGHRVVFCDCNGNNYTISIPDFQKKITSKTKAIIAVHLYGHPCNMDEIKRIAYENKLKIIEDCAQSHGAEYKGEKVGKIGDIGIFSFYPGKNLGAYGDGGAIVTKNEELANKCRMIANHGRLEKYNHKFEGRNSRLDGMQAAILKVKLSHLNEWNQERIELADKYNNDLKGIKGISIPIKEKWAKHIYHLYVIRVKNRDELRARLGKSDIETGIHYPIALPKLKAYEYIGQAEEEMLVNKIDGELLSLPMGDHLHLNDVSYITECIKQNCL